MKRKFISALSALILAASALTGCASDRERSYSYEYSTTPYYFIRSEIPAPEQSSSEIHVSSSFVISTPNSSTTSSSGSSTTSKPISSSSASSKPAQTTVTSSSTLPTQTPVPVNDAPYRPTVLDTKSDEFVAYTTGNAELNAQENFTPYLYDFRTGASVGYSLSDTAHQLPVEADYGIKGVFNGSVATIQTYDHTDKNLTVVNSYMSGLDIGLNKTIEWAFSEKPQYCDAQNLPNGLYKVTVTFSNQTTSELYFLVNGDEYLFCQMIIASDKTWNASQNIDMIRKRRNNLNDLIKKYNITPSNSLDVDIIQYPYYNLNGWRRDTDRWANLSDEITDPSWSDERKLYAICDWLSQNIAYDYYVFNVLHDNRSRYYNVLDGGQSVWNLRAGVCRDFGQILTIMCRKQGIPADVITNATHLWNVVYINGRWIEVDICDTNRYSVSGEDTTKRNVTYKTYKNFLSLMGTDCSGNYGEEIRVWLYMGQCF